MTLRYTMADVKSALQNRFKTESEAKSSKMKELAKQTTSGNLSTFAGVFKVGSLTDTEQQSLQDLLDHYKTPKQETELDFSDLSAITSEVKAINNQAVILHGERIKKAQAILKKYKDGAFSAWLVYTYGNRQTPYNFLLYFEFYRSMEPLLQKQIDLMPRQAIYTLASRKGEIERKKHLIQTYKGETKNELLQLIRESFPLNENDKRKDIPAEMAIRSLSLLVSKLNKTDFKPSLEQSVEINKLLDQIRLLTLKR